MQVFTSFQVEFLDNLAKCILKIVWYCTASEVSNLFIVSLAVADVIVGIIVMPMSAFYIFTDRWMLGVAVCQIWIGVDYTASTASILNLFILSLDRYWSVRQPLKYLHKRTKRRALSMIGVVWAVSSLWIIPISSWHYFAHDGVRTVENDKCDTEYAKNSAFKLVTAFFNFYLPLSVMYILYFRIFIAIRRRSEFELGQRNPGGTVLSYKSNVPNSADESECNDDLSCSIDSRYVGSLDMRPRENGTRNHVATNGPRNLRVLTMKRVGVPCAYRDSKPFKVEYIYDENVIDPQTEKIERYYYEDHYPIPCLSRPTWVVGHEKMATTVGHRPGRLRSPRDFSSLKVPSTSSIASSSSSASKDLHQISVPNYMAVGYKNNAVVKRSIFRRSRSPNPPSTLNDVRLESYRKFQLDEASFAPSLYKVATNTSSSSSSSASTFGEEKRRSSDVSRDMTRVEKSHLRENYSVVGGVRKLRQVESFLDQTAGLGLASNVGLDISSSRNVEDFDSVLHDERNRRLTAGVTGLKERLRTIRQSSSLNKEIKAARQLGVIMGAFTLCFLPYFILFLVVAFCDNCIRPGHLTAATWVGYLNSTLNPFLYPLCNANFRTKFRSMLSCCGKSRNKSRNGHQEYCERNTAFNSRYD
ncbi:muscarinic acetylcholine receptor M3 [Biomphalaria glabrata]|nr:muscarinic acetylcholine receptor M3 [Biomphalaria glabrata]